MITLRDYLESDIKTLVYLANNKNVSRYLTSTFPYPYTKNDAEFWIRIGSKENETTSKVILYNNQFVGSIGISRQFGWKSHIAEIGYWLGEHYWNQGIASKALEIMTTEAFDLHKIKKLYAIVLEPNTASMKILQRCHYLLEGVLMHDVMKDGKLYHIHHYARYNV